VQIAETFRERREEIVAYLDFLRGVEEVIRSGVPRLGADGPAITVQQQKILYSSVYLQLYNLVESTVTGCLDAVSVSALSRSRCRVGELNAELRREWVRHIARTHTDMSPDRRLDAALNMCEHLVSALPVEPFSIEKGGGGNWDDEEIFRIANRIGFALQISPQANRAAKAKIREDRGALALVVYLRNGLAHGRLSFVECGQDDSVADLTELAERVFLYLGEVVTAFERHIEQDGHLSPEVRSAAQA